MRITVRPAAPEDAPAMGQVHVRAWQKGYQGQLPQDYLDQVSASQREAMWRRRLERDVPRARVWVAEVAGNGVVGFATIGPEGFDRDAVNGELFAMNVDPAHWGTGVGNALMADVLTGLVDFGYPEAVLWVLPTNARARRFYERHGWHNDETERTDEVLGVAVPELRYRHALPAPFRSRDTHHAGELRQSG